VLSVGTQEPRKNLERLVQAVDGTDFPLVLVGRHGWGDKTQTLGYVPDVDLSAIYSAATIFAYPSLYEGFGFPVLEAMACGTPVVTSNISSLPEIVGEAGVLVDPLSIEGIKLGILKAGQDRDSLIKLGITRAQDFSWASTASQVLEVYEKIKNRD
jgi:glycosyltransferase involved in cell wall biosynthesis